MRSGGNNFNYFPENQLTIIHNPEPPTPFALKISSDLRELHMWPLAFRGEQLLHLLHTSYATAENTSWKVKHIQQFCRFLIPAKERGYVFRSVCLSVCLSARLLESCERILMNFWRGEAWITIRIQEFHKVLYSGLYQVSLFARCQHKSRQWFVLPQRFQFV